jgi:hypothetical protein
MKKTFFLFLFCLIFLSYMLAQTKKIALESHSGSQTEFNIDGDGNFGSNPIMEAEMHRYYDSVHRVDSIKDVKRKMDSVWKLDSAKQAKKKSPQYNPRKKKNSGLHAAADFKKSSSALASYR